VGRNLNISDYRFGYQGSEMTNEMSGNGNEYTTYFRQLDPRLGRWFSVDPVVQPWQSPYMSMDGNPVGLNDQMGNLSIGNLRINKKQGGGIRVSDGKGVKFQTGGKKGKKNDKGGVKSAKNGPGKRGRNKTPENGPDERGPRIPRNYTTAFNDYGSKDNNGYFTKTVTFNHREDDRGSIAVIVRSDGWSDDLRSEDVEVIVEIFAKHNEGIFGTSADERGERILGPTTFKGVEDMHDRLIKFGPDFSTWRDAYTDPANKPIRNNGNLGGTTFTVVFKTREPHTTGIRIVVGGSQSERTINPRYRSVYRHQKLHITNWLAK